MSDIEPWTRQLLSVIVSQLCKTIGWHSISTTSLQVLVDVLHRYLKQVGSAVHDYSEHYNHTFPGLEELFLAFNYMDIDIDDLREYAKYVAPITIKEKVPKYPLEKKSNLNFLKPGSREVVTRPVHIHEHLPAMYPELSEDYSSHDIMTISTSVNKENMTLPSLTSSTSSTTSYHPPASSAAAATSSAVSVKPGDREMLTAATINNKHLTCATSEEIGRPLRELSSVMMTTSGFLSPALEGKAPDTRAPKLLNYINNSVNISNNTDNHQHNLSSSTQQSSAPSDDIKNQHHKKHGHKSSKTAEFKVRNGAAAAVEPARTTPKNLGVEKSEESKLKKLPNMKELSKLKAFKPSINKSNDSLVVPSKAEKTKISIPNSQVTSSKEPKMPKQIIEKVEKIEPPVPSLPSPKLEPSETVVEKLITEPSKHKLNIFKRLSTTTKVKEERPESPPIHKTDYHHHHNQQDRNAQINDCIEAVVKRSTEKDVSTYKPASISFASGKDEPVDQATSTTQMQSTSTFIEHKFEPILLSSEEIYSSTLPVVDQQVKRKKKQKPHGIQLSSKKFKTSHRRETSPLMPSQKPEQVSSNATEKPKLISGPEPPPYSFFMQMQNTPGLLPPSLSSNLLIPRFPHPFMNVTKVDPNGAPHPEMPNLPLPPATLMQASVPYESNHTFSTNSTTAADIPVSSKRLSIAAAAEKKMAKKKAAKVASRLLMSDKKLKKKMKKDKREKDKKKQEKKEKPKNKEKLKKKKELKKLKAKKDKLTKGEKSSLLKKEQLQHLPNDNILASPSAVPKLKLKFSKGGSSSPQLSPTCSGPTGAGSVAVATAPSAGSSQSPKIVIKPVLKPVEYAQVDGAHSSYQSSASFPSSSTSSLRHNHDEFEAPSISSPELAKIAYINKPTKQKNSSSSKSVASTVDVLATNHHHHHRLKPNSDVSIELS